MAPKTAIVYDHGLYTYLAQKLAEDYGKVYYHLAHSTPYPSSDVAEIGKNLPGIEPVAEFFKLLQSVDKANTVVCFFDNYCADIQEDLRRQGWAVCGSGKAEVLELDRLFFREALKRLKLPCAPYTVVVGITAAQIYLADKTDKFLKTSRWRGDFETYHYVDAEHARVWFDDLRYRLGIRADKVQVIVEDPVEGIEVGADGFRQDEAMSPFSSWGYEIKDGCYVGVAGKALPKLFTKIDERFSPLFKSLGYQGMYSNEIRLTDKKVPYFTDPCCRTPSPPGELLCEWYENFGEAVWVSAHGGLPELKPRARYGAQLVLSSPWNEDHWLHVEIPPEIRRWAKLKNATVMDGKEYVIPNKNDGFFGGVVAFGDDWKRCLKEVMQRAGQIKAYELNFLADAPKKCAEAIAKGEELGLAFG